MRDPQDYAGIWIFLREAKWKETFAMLPHVCRISKRWIWLKKAYKGVATYNTGSVFPVTETHWHETGEHIKWLLTKDYVTDSSGFSGYSSFSSTGVLLGISGFSGRSGIPMTGGSLNKVKINTKLLVIINEK